jgi:hypothetical protein
VTNETTLQIIDVEPDEAGWCLAILEKCLTTTTSSRRRLRPGRPLSMRS